MKCIFCPNAVTEGYVCDACHKDAEMRRLADENLALNIRCMSCSAGRGERCRTGSGNPRSPHEARLQKARKAHV